jgi:Cof subfamily protein (haloacid dehalogenase superfamily)
MSYKFLIMDLDDTILPRAGDISERSKQAIRRAQEAGILVSLASGRTFGSASKFARELGIDLPLITHQGALIKDPASGQVLYEDLIPSDMMREIITFSREHDLHLNLYMDDDVFVEREGEELEIYTDLSRKGGTPIPDLTVKLDRNPTKFIVVSRTPERTEAILPLLRASFSDHLSILRSHPLLIEGVMPTVSKGRALSMLADHLGVSRAETVAIGDNENDVDMLTWAGLGLAMGNAAPEVQAAADYVLPPIWEEGAAYGIEHYVLNGRQ